MNRKQALEIFSKGFNKFVDRKGYTLNSAGDILGCKSANISKIKAGIGFPSVEGIFTLVEHGMRLEEIFGAELAEKLTAGLEPVLVDGKPDAFDTPEFRQGVIKAIADMASRGIK